MYFRFCVNVRRDNYPVDSKNLNLPTSPKDSSSSQYITQRQYDWVSQLNLLF